MTQPHKNVYNVIMLFLQMTGNVPAVMLSWHCVRIRCAAKYILGMLISVPSAEKQTVPANGHVTKRKGILISVLRMAPASDNLEPINQPASHDELLAMFQFGGPVPAAGSKQSSGLPTLA